MKRTLLAIGSMLQEEMDKLDQDFSVVRLWQEQDPEATIRAMGSDVQAILSTYNGPGVSAKMMEALPNLEVIAQYGVGYDNIDIAAAKVRGITVTNTPGVLTNDTADLALALLLAVSRRVAEADMFIRAGKWGAASFPLGTALSGKTAAVIGMGRIGQAIAQRLAAFGMNVIYHGPRKKDNVSYGYEPDFIKCLNKSDYVVLACAATPDTKNMMNRAALSAMKSSAFLINIARGSVVDQDVLVEKLVNRSIAGAGLDVFAMEPHVPAELKSLDNVVLTPHIGSATIETRHIMGQLVLDNLRAYFDGNPVLTPVAA